MIGNPFGAYQAPLLGSYVVGDEGGSKLPPERGLGCCRALLVSRFATVLCQLWWPRGLKAADWLTYDGLEA